MRFLNREVDIQLGPVQMIWAWPLDFGQLLDGGLPEPWEVLEGQQQLLVAEQNPEPVLRDVGYFGSKVAVPGVLDFLDVCLDNSLCFGKLAR